jgi:glycosyltransferase involved in cell wall biosynthesis
MIYPIPRAVALLASYNEERFICGCLEHLFRNHVEAYLIDNCSTDNTLALAKRYLGHGLIGFETLPRAGVYSWRPILERKEQLANTLEADWFINVDPDEIRLPPYAGISLAEAFAVVEQQGYNAVNFQEFTFIPTLEEPDHDHPNFAATMKHYYPFGSDQRQIKAWRRPAGPVEFAFSGAHQVRFDGSKVSPVNFLMKHYMFLSAGHADRKYAQKAFDPAEIKIGWHGLRSRWRLEMIKLPPASELRLFTSDNRLDASHPRSRHYLFG